jgi:DNA-binding transcriptional MerR regulator
MAYYSPTDIASLLKCKTSTLRKYALLMESVGFTYEKNKQGHRFYSDTDLVALQKLVSYSNSGDTSLKESAEAVFLWSKGNDIAQRDTTHATPSTVIERDSTITTERFLTVLDEQQRTIQSMATMLEEQANQNALIMQELTDTRDAIRRLTEQFPTNQILKAPEQPIEKDNRGLWARILNK